MSFAPPYVSKAELAARLKEAGLYTARMEKALYYAEQAHKDQLRDQGNPYLEEHIYPIAMNVLARHEKDPELESIAILGVLHDVLEDDPNVSPSAIGRDFGEEMLASLFLVTKKPQENNGMLSQDEKRKVNEKMLKALEGASYIPQIIKLEDRLNNLSSFEKADRPKYERYVEETKNLFIPFAEKAAPLYKELLMAQVKRLYMEGSARAV